MASETLSFDIVGRDAGASTAFRRAGDAATLAARGARTAALALEQQKKAADASARATLSLAAADKILADVEDEVSGKNARLRSEMEKTAAAAKKAASGGAGSSGGGKAGFFDRGLAGGIGPGIAGINAKWASLIGLGGVGLGALPALTAIGGTAAIGGIGASFISSGARELIGTKTKPGELYKPAQQAMAAFQKSFAQAAQGLAKPLRQVFAEMPQLMKSIAPALHAAFAGAGSLIQPLLKGLGELARAVLPELGKAFRVVGPLLGIALHAFAQLASGLLPGLVTLLKAARPAFTALASVLGTVGKSLGSMFRSFAPVMKSSALIFKALGDVVAGLFPIIGKLAAIFAKTLAPVFGVVAGIIKSLEPVLIVVGKIIAGFAKAVLGDLAAAFGAIGTLIKDLAPSFKILASVLGSVFQTLENTGVFAILGDALEALAKPLAGLVNALVTGLAPVLPPIIALVNQVGGILIKVLVSAVKAVIPLLVMLIKDILQPIIPLIKALAPLIGLLAKLLGAGLTAAIKLVTPLLQFVIKIIGYLTGALTVAIKWVISLAKNWRQAWADVKQWASDAWNFLTHGWGQFLVPGLTLIRKVIEIVRDHWRAAWGVIKAVARDAWHFIETTVIHPLMTAWNTLKNLWNWLTGHSSSGSWNSGGGLNIAATGAQKYAQSQLGSHGWSGSQWAPLYNLWQRESGWNRLARNPRSGAYGIPQALPPSKMGAAANPPVSSAVAQINWGLSYIKGRYGSPAAAWGHEMSYGWYDRGGWLRPGLNLAYNGTGLPERVLGPGEGGVVIHIGGRGGGRNSLDALLREWVRHNVRVEGGGDVQVAFGGG